MVNGAQTKEPSQARQAFKAATQGSQTSTGERIGYVCSSALKHIGVWGISAC